MDHWSSRVSHAFIVIFHISLALSLFIAGTSRLYCHKFIAFVHTTRNYFSLYYVKYSSTETYFKQTVQALIRYRLRYIRVY
jgi:hypothetical protein